MKNKKILTVFLAAAIASAVIVATGHFNTNVVQADANPFPDLEYLNAKQNKGEMASLPSIGINENYDESITGKFNAESMGKSGIKKIEPWKEYNNDVVGWLKVPGTNINYPVVHRDNNSYYRALGYDKKYSKHGVIWQDYESRSGSRKELSRNTILYGHNWDNIFVPAVGDPRDSYFGQLMSYHYKDFATQYPYIYYSMGEDEMVWQVFATFYTDTNFYYISSNPSKEKLQTIIDTARERSRHDFNVEVDSTDRILTLSTCTRVYGPRADQRFVVMAKLLSKAEAEELKAVKVTENKDFVHPQFANPLPGYPIA